MIDFNNGKVMEQVKEIPFFGDYDVKINGSAFSIAHLKNHNNQYEVTV